MRMWVGGGGSPGTETIPNSQFKMELSYHSVKNPLTEIVLVDSLTNVGLCDGKLKLIVLDICSGGAQTATDNTLYQHQVNITIILHTKNNTTQRIPN